MSNVYRWKLGGKRHASHYIVLYYKLLRDTEMKFSSIIWAHCRVEMS